LGAVAAGFVTIGSIIGLGILLAQLKVLDVSAQRMLTTLTFYVAAPALMVTVLSGADISRVFSANLIASVGGVALSAAIYVCLARLVWRRSVGDTVIGTFASCYVNAGNLGLPIAAYVLRDASYVVPMLITQLVLLQPLGLAVLDMVSSPDVPDQSRGQRILRRLYQPFLNPLLIGSLIGLLLAVLHVTLPRALHDPLALVGGMAVPAMLLAYGVSLRTGPLPGAGEPPVQIAVIGALKLVVQPLAAYLLARYVLGLQPLEVLAVTVVAALPTAQNVFTFAIRYRQAEVLARDAIFVTTIGSIPVLLLIAGLLA
jgi:malonate transporter and related proteins